MTVVLRLSPADVPPTTIMVYVAVGVVDDVVIVSVEVNVGIPTLKLNVVVAPGGEPLKASSTGWVPPLTNAPLILNVALPPCWMAPDAGIALKVKSNGGGVRVVTVADGPLVLQLPVASPASTLKVY